MHMGKSEAQLANICYAEKETIKNIFRFGLLSNYDLAVGRINKFKHFED
eukprot:CAMPEP_0168608582 /NCGR_PEP_ID=MMETSP0449_2-20121227/709_1 /TAXON_ID=1082188 /ORGANISM="Strombidium rassoulzadegani, Strain ras09" /LENGTH=48 /DNA_ID= /DNA_START= /DNA_END= /DNA_ORIENTATION=